MAGTQPGSNSTAAAAITSGLGAVGAGGPMRLPAQVLIDLMDKLTALLTATVIPANKDEHDAEVARVREEIARAKEALAAEDTRLAAERVALDARAHRLQSEAYQLTMSLNASNEVMRRRHQKSQSCLPPVYDPRNLFATPVAGPSKMQISL